MPPSPTRFRVGANGKIQRCQSLGLHAGIGTKLA
jgi:hypothetical protein